MTAGVQELALDYMGSEVTLFHKPGVLTRPVLRRLQGLQKSGNEEDALDEIYKLLPLMIDSWSLTNDGEPADVKETLDVLPLQFIVTMFWSIANDLNVEDAEGKSVTSVDG